MLSRVQAGARLLCRVTGSSVSGRCQQIFCDLRGPAQQQWLAAAPRTSSSSSTAARPLSGKNIFQLRAAVGAVETPADQQEQQQQQQPQQQKKQQQQKQQKQPKQAHVQQQEAPKIVPLPTSDESEQLLKIRHSVSGFGAIGQPHLVLITLLGCWRAADLHSCTHICLTRALTGEVDSMQPLFNCRPAVSDSQSETCTDTHGIIYASLCSNGPAG